jgi:hypothetical protein
MWSLGALLYQLITGRTLFNNNTEDNLDEHDLRRLCQWNADDLQDALDNVHNRRGKHQPLGCDLLEQLLQPEAVHRPKSFKRVLDHPFFVGQSDGSERSDHASAESIEASLKIVNEMNEKMDQMLDSQKRLGDLLAAIHARTINIESTSETTFLQLCKTERVLLRGMFEATEVTRPTSFIILPNKIDPEPPSPTSSVPMLQFAEDGSGIELSAAGEEVKGQLEIRKGWFNKICKLGSNVRDAIAGEGTGALAVQAMEEVAEFIGGHLEDGVMYLYLIDEYTGSPVIPTGKDGVYPITITEPSKNAVRFLPLMRTGLKVMSVVNGAAFVGHMLGVPIPSVPSSCQEWAKTAVGNLDKKSSVAEFDVLQETIDSRKGRAGGADKQAVRGSALREFEQFLAEEDSNNDFSGLNRVVTADGRACWTSLNEEQFTAEEAKKTQKSKISDSVEAFTTEEAKKSKVLACVEVLQLAAIGSRK